jgi:hypothetical protein
MVFYVHIRLSTSARHHGVKTWNERSRFIEHQKDGCRKPVNKDLQGA